VFPYHFVWDARRTTPSSFGSQGTDGAYGIASTRTGKLVARRTFVRQGEGEDCALVVAYRMFQPPTKREMGKEDERIVIVILGHSGPGTDAGAVVATDPKYAPGLYPAKQGVPRTRVVAAKYQRPSPTMRDNREVTSAVLVDDGKRREAGAAAKAGQRRQKSRHVVGAKRKRRGGRDTASRAESTRNKNPKRKR
jgi:hypothetical protein